MLLVPCFCPVGTAYSSARPPTCLTIFSPTVHGASNCVNTRKLNAEYSSRLPLHFAAGVGPDIKHFLVLYCHRHEICFDMQRITAAAGCVYLASRIVYARGYYTGGKYLSVLYAVGLCFS